MVDTFNRCCVTAYFHRYCVNTKCFRTNSTDRVLWEAVSMLRSSKSIGLTEPLENKLQSACIAWQLYFEAFARILVLSGKILVTMGKGNNTGINFLIVATLCETIKTMASSWAITSSLHRRESPVVALWRKDTFPPHKFVRLSCSYCRFQEIRNYDLGLACKGITSIWNLMKIHSHVFELMYGYRWIDGQSELRRCSQECCECAWKMTSHWATSVVSDAWTSVCYTVVRSSNTFQFNDHTFSINFKSPK